MAHKPSPNAALLVELGFCELQPSGDGLLSFVNDNGMPIHELSDDEAAVAGLILMIFTGFAAAQKQDRLYVTVDIGDVETTGVLDEGHVWLKAASENMGAHGYTKIESPATAARH